MAFRTEPTYTHGQSPKTAILYCNLGTPDAPTAPALRRYLAEFLGDSRVVEMYTLVAVVYFVLSFLLSQGVKRLLASAANLQLLKG